MTRRRTIGVLGGMGPLATVDLYRKIIENTPARTDQDHLPVLIDADPSVPDRTEALLDGGEDPTPWLVRGAKRLADSGASFIIIPCNTAHAFLDRVRPACPIPVIDMIDEAARAAAGLVPEGSSVGILATRGTIAAGLYQAALQEHGLVPAVPDDRGQDLLMETIHSVKSGTISDEAAAPAIKAARTLESEGAQALLAACTELPVVLRAEHFSIPLIDPTDVLARAAIRAATDDAAFEQLRISAEKVQDHVI
jgi:aspartate racemase